MNSLSILAIKYSPTKTSFKARRDIQEEKIIQLKQHEDLPHVVKPENLVIGSAIMPGSGQAILGKKKEAALFAAGSFASWGISAYGIVKTTKAIINKTNKMKSRVGNGIAGAALIAVGITGQAIIRAVSATKTLKTIVEESKF